MKKIHCVQLFQCIFVIMRLVLVVMVIFFFDVIFSLNIVRKLDELEEQVNISNDYYEEGADMGKSIDTKRNEKDLDKNEELAKPIKVNDDSDLFVAESQVYRPLFVYRKIEHSRRRINMYNAFAG